MRVVDVSKIGDNQFAEAILHNWDPDIPIRFPLSVVDSLQIKHALTQDFKSELRLFAKVNVGCHDGNELFFNSFEFAPEPYIDVLTP